MRRALSKAELLLRMLEGALFKRRYHPPRIPLGTLHSLHVVGGRGGDLLDWLSDFIVGCDRRAVLVELVKRELLPALQQRIEVEVIETIHNPIRATTVDGVDVTEWHYEVPIIHPVKLTPEHVTVSGLAVLELARQLTATPAIP